MTLLPEKGTEIYSLVYKPRGMDVLWKSPWGLTPRGSGFAFAGGNTEAAWMDQYGGGWQEIFPNGGDECVYKNASLPFHGEASVQAWDYKIQRRDSSSVAIWRLFSTKPGRATCDRSGPAASRSSRAPMSPGLTSSPHTKPRIFGVHLDATARSTISRACERLWTGSPVGMNSIATYPE